MGRLKTKTVQVTAKFLKKKTKNVKKVSHRESFCCPKCKELLVGVEAVRLRSRPKLTKHMQKLLRKRELNEQSLTVRQQELVQRAMQQCNVLVMKCNHCQWQAEIKLESRESQHRRKSRQKAEQDQQAELADAAEGDSQPLDKMAQEKLKKKERRKKVAEAKAKDLQQFKRFSISSVNSAPERYDEEPVSSTPRLSMPSSLSLSVESLSPIPSESSSLHGKSNFKTGKSMTQVTPQSSQRPSRPTAQSAHSRAGSSGPLSGIHKRRIKTPGKQQLRNILSQQKKDSLNIKDSLSQFLNSMK